MWWTRTVSQPVDVLAIAAHPDDAEVGCGGALLVSAAQGLRVAVAELTRGERSTLGDIERREAERGRATELLSLSERRWLDLPDTAIGTDPAHREPIVAVLRELRPRVMLAPWVDDRHPDHAAAGRIAREAAFLAGVRSVGSGEPHRPEHIYHYVMHHPVEPTFVLDVTSVWEQRMAAIMAYESQFGRPRTEQATEISGPDFLSLLTARANFYGAMVGVERGEPYRSVGPLHAELLPGLRGPRVEGPRGYRSYL